MQPNIPNNPYPNAGVPNYGGQPYPYSPVPPQMAQQRVSVPSGVQPIPAAAPADYATLSEAAKAQRSAATAKSAPATPAKKDVPEHKKTVLADGTVLPDVIYVKKKGTLFCLIIVSVLLVACGIYAFITTNNYNSTKTIADELTETNKKQEETINTVIKTLGLSSSFDLTEDTLNSIVKTPDGAVDIDLSTFGDPNAAGIRTIRVSPNLRYALAEVSYYGNTNYYYREIRSSGWILAFSRNNRLSCREVSKKAMEVITDLGGIDKNMTDDGKSYDCIDPENGDKIYDFPDALAEGIYQ